MKKKYFPLNIQLFAEGGVGSGEPDNKETPNKTYSQEDMDKLIAERDKFKKANDDLSKENADFKRKNKEKMSEEEKIAQARKEQDDLLKQTQKELLGMKLSKEFISAGFDDTATQELVEAYTEKDSVEFAKVLSKNIKSLVDNAIKNEQEKFKQNPALPPNGKSSSGINPVVEKYIKGKDSNNKAKDYYLGKK